jgi:hypothetical protein
MMYRMMHPKKLTPWFPGHVKPVHKGIYQRTTRWGEQYYSKWDGEFWCAYATNFALAEKFTQASMFQDWEWRGLAEDPSTEGVKP